MISFSFWLAEHDTLLTADNIVCFWEQSHLCLSQHLQHNVMVYFLGRLYFLTSYSMDSRCWSFGAVRISRKMDLRPLARCFRLWWLGACFLRACGWSSVAALFLGSVCGNRLVTLTGVFTSFIIHSQSTKLLWSTSAMCRPVMPVAGEQGVPPCPLIACTELMCLPLGSVLPDRVHIVYWGFQTFLLFSCVLLIFSGHFNLYLHLLVLLFFLYFIWK